MRYSIEPKYIKYFEGYDQLSLAREFGDKYGKKLMDTVTKQGQMLQKSLLKQFFKKQQWQDEI